LYPGLLVIEKKVNVTAVTQCLGFTVTSFETGLVSTAVTGGTMPWLKQLVDVVGAAVLYLNGEEYVTTGSLINTDVS